LFCYDFQNKTEEGSAIKPFTQIRLIVIVSLFFVLVDNYTFFKNVLNMSLLMTV